jgi:hypothetical protein
MADKCPDMLDKVSFNDRLYLNGTHNR